MATITTSSQPESKPVKIYVGTPCYGGQCFAGYCASLLQTQVYLSSLSPPARLETCFLTNESLITRGRNTIVAKFLSDPSFTHLLFIDSDISWHPMTVEKLLKADKDIVGAIYPKKGYTWANIAKVLPSLVDTDEQGKVKMDDNGAVQFKSIDSKMEAYVKANLMNYTMNYSTNRRVDNNLLEVKHIGTGFMMIKREVLEKMADHFPQTKYDDDINILNEVENSHLYSLFDCEISMGSDNKLHYLSEDYLFCKRWIDMGGKIYAEVTSPLTHTGTHSFQGHYLASLRFETNGGPRSILNTSVTKPTSPEKVEEDADATTPVATTPVATTPVAVPEATPTVATPPVMEGVNSEPIKPLTPKDVSKIKII